jgi:hypothetical protein
MTPKRHSGQDVERALKLLYGHGGWNLTSDAYLEALGKLRSSDPAAAKRVERILRPYLEERIFPVRKVKWHQTSEGTRARLALLPQNPHVRQDVVTIRSVLGFSAGHVVVTEGDALWADIQRHVRPEAVRRVAEGNLAGAWLSIHRRAAAKESPLEDAPPGFLSSELRQAAVSSAGVNMRADTVPEWLQRPPSGPAPYDNPQAPIDWAVGRLLERHRLPWSIASSVAFYLLTQDAEWLSALEPVQVEIASDQQSSSSPWSFKVIVRGVDEFITEEDWGQVWTRFVRPRQDRLWQLRGMKPEGRRGTQLDRLQRWMLLYRQMIDENLTMAKVLRRSSIDDIDSNVDQETARRALKDLRELLTPAA